MGMANLKAKWVLFYYKSYADHFRVIFPAACEYNQTSIILNAGLTDT